MEPRPNEQGTNKLNQFQRLVVQGHYINYLKKGIDYFAWENEKKEAIIEMREKEIEELKSSMDILKGQKEKTELQFREYIQKVKESKKGVTKEQKEIEVSLRRDIESLKQRLQVSHRMNQLLTKQNKKL
jgi:hypothetical protein